MLVASVALLRTIVAPRMMCCIELVLSVDDHEVYDSFVLTSFLSDISVFKSDCDDMLLPM